jgi:hypothetical protein
MENKHSLHPPTSLYLYIDLYPSIHPSICVNPIGVKSRVKSLISPHEFAPFFADTPPFQWIQTPWFFDVFWGHHTFPANPR